MIHYSPFLFQCTHVAVTWQKRAQLLVVVERPKPVLLHITLLYICQRVSIVWLIGQNSLTKTLNSSLETMKASQNPEKSRVNRISSIITTHLYELLAAKYISTNARPMFGLQFAVLMPGLADSIRKAYI